MTLQQLRQGSCFLAPFVGALLWSNSQAAASNVPSPHASGAVVQSSVTVPVPTPSGSTASDGLLAAGVTGSMTGPITVQADELSGDAEGGGHLMGKGHVVLTRGSTSIYADEVDVDLASQLVTAAGTVRIVNPLGSLSASNLTYNAHGESSGAGLVGRIAGFSIRAAHFQMLPGVAGKGPVVLAMDGAITSCTFDHPDYLLSAHQIQFNPGSSILLHGAGVSLFGVKLVTLPKVTIPLKGKSQHHSGSTLPRLFYSSATGFGLQLNSSLHLAPGASGRYDLILSQRLGVSGDLDFTRLAGTPLELRLSRREQYPRRRFPRLTVDKLPELRLPVLAVPGTGSRPVSLIGDLFAGYYREDSTHVSDRRLLARAAAVYGPSGAATRPVVGLAFSEALYSGSNYTVAGAQLGFQSQIMENLLGRLVFEADTTRGRTPFAFDYVEAPRRLELSLDDTSVNWGWSVDSIYDLNRHEIYETEVSFSHLLKCLRPTIGYRFRDREISFSIGIPALETAGSLLSHPTTVAPSRQLDYSWGEGGPLPQVR